MTTTSLTEVWALPMEEAECHRLRGIGILDGDGCRCFIEGGRGFLPCPKRARSVMLETRRIRSELAGEFCRDCGGVAMVRTGTCMTCLNCGSTSGGCS